MDGARVLFAQLLLQDQRYGAVAQGSTPTREAALLDDEFVFGRRGEGQRL